MKTRAIQTVTVAVKSARRRRATPADLRQRARGPWLTRIQRLVAERPAVDLPSQDPKSAARRAAPRTAPVPPRAVTR
jgi:hypothetical protein